MLFTSLPNLDFFLDAPVELRLDLFPHIDFAALPTKNVLFTLRKGSFKGSEKTREALILKLLDLHPAYFDLESDMREEFLCRALTSYPQTRFILSHHTFGPIDLPSTFHEMRRLPCYAYKIAFQPQTATEALEALLFMKENPSLSVICMGEKNAFTRVLGSLQKERLSYASLNTKTAPGQLSLQDLTEIYRTPSLASDASLYGLIGSPIDQSVGHLYHNSVFKKLNLNAVYVKMDVTPDELPHFFRAAKKIGFKGLSVTMPLKEAVLPFLEIDEKAKQIGAVNTISFKDGKLYGTNTDGIGALDAIEKRMKVKDKTFVILGAGGAARAVAFEAIQRKANVTIVNRTAEKGKRLASFFQCDWKAEAPHDADILINCSPAPVHFEHLQSRTLLMDIVYSTRETPFLQRGLSLGCPVIYGEEMFINQAKAQT